ncbi:hypothetical protein ACFQX6_30515 [Streptosporangium lutulentum]
MKSNRRTPTWAAALIGLVSGAVAVGVSLLVAGLVKASAFPVVAVGNAAVDLTPAWLKDWAIRAFGENDKTILLLGIFVVLAAIAAGIGILALREIRYGLVGLAVFGVVGILAVLTRPGAGVVDVVPTLVGVAAAMFALHRLIGRAFVPDPSASRSPGSPAVGPSAPRSPLSTETGTEAAERQDAPVPPIMRAGNSLRSFDRRGLLTGVVGGAVVAGVAAWPGRCCRDGRR